MASVCGLAADYSAGSRDPVRLWLRGRFARRIFVWWGWVVSETAGCALLTHTATLGVRSPAHVSLAGMALRRMALCRGVVA